MQNYYEIQTEGGIMRGFFIHLVKRLFQFVLFFMDLLDVILEQNFLIQSYHEC